VDWKTFRRWEGQPNVLERDYQMKVAMGFRPEVFTRAHGLLRMTRETYTKTGLINQGMTEKPGEFSN
jgi:hypothetical protein